MLACHVGRRLLPAPRAGGGERAPCRRAAPVPLVKVGLGVGGDTGTQTRSTTSTRSQSIRGPLAPPHDPRAPLCARGPLGGPRRAVRCGGRRGTPQVRGFLYNGQPIAAACDAAGEWSLVVFNQDPCQQAPALQPNDTTGRLVRVRGLSRLASRSTGASPSDAVAVATHDLRLLLIEVNSVARRWTMRRTTAGSSMWRGRPTGGGSPTQSRRRPAHRVRDPAVRGRHGASGRGHARPHARHVAHLDPGTRFVASPRDACVRSRTSSWQLNFSRAQRPYVAMLTRGAADPMRPPPRPGLVPGGRRGRGRGVWRRRQRRRRRRRRRRWRWRRQEAGRGSRGDSDALTTATTCPRRGSAPATSPAASCPLPVAAGGWISFARCGTAY